MDYIPGNKSTCTETGNLYVKLSQWDLRWKGKTQKVTESGV